MKKIIAQQENIATQIRIVANQKRDDENRIITDALNRLEAIRKQTDVIILSLDKLRMDKAGVTSTPRDFLDDF